MSVETGKKHRLLCIVCPEGCEMEIGERDGELVFPEGVCRRGRAYARREIWNPARVLTTTVCVRGAEVAVLPVRTAAPIPIGRLEAAMRAVAGLTVQAPVRVGDVILPDVAGTGVPLLACRALSPCP